MAASDLARFTSASASPVGASDLSRFLTGAENPDTGEGSGNIFANAFQDLKDIVGGIATLAGTVGSDLIQGVQEVGTLGKAEGDFMSDDIVNAITGGMLNTFGEGWHPSESVLVQDYANRYGSLEKFGTGLLEHPLAFISDILMVATLGGTAAGTAAGVLAKSGRAGEAATAISSSLGKVASVADELRFLEAGRLLPEQLGTAAKFVAAVQGEAFKYIDPITGKLGYFDPVRNPVKRMLFQEPGLKLLMERKGAGLKTAETLASEALNGGAEAISVFNHAQQVQKLLNSAMAVDAPIMKRWAATYKAKRYIDFMYGSSKLRKTAVIRDVDRAAAELLKDLPDGVTEIDVMNAAMGLDGALVNDGYVPPVRHGRRGLRRAEVFDLVGPETSGAGSVLPGVNVLDGDLVDANAAQLMGYVDPAHVDVDPNGPVVMEVNPTTGEARVASGTATLNQAARSGGSVPTNLRHGVPTAEVERELADAYKYIESRTDPVAASQPTGTTFRPQPADDVNWVEEGRHLAQAKHEGRARELPNNVWVYDSPPDVPPFRVYVRVDAEGKVVSTREVDTGGKVIAATAGDLNQLGHGTTLTLAHWADENVKTAADIERVIGKNVLSGPAIKMNKRAARMTLRGPDSPNTAPSVGGRVLSAELRDTLSRGEPVSKDVIAEMAGDLHAEFGPGVVQAGPAKGVGSVARKAALAGGMDAVDDAGPRFRIIRHDMNTEDGLRQAVTAAGEAVGGTLRRVENQVATPGADGSRLLRAIYDTDAGAVEIQFMTPYAHQVMDATTNLRSHLEGMARMLSRETDHAVRQDLARRIKMAESYSQNLWAGVTAEMREALGGHVDGALRKKLDKLRVELHRTMGDAAIEGGLPVESLFENPYLAQRMMNGATWDPVSEEFIGGGMKVLELDQLNAEGGRMAPVYMPAIDGRRLPTRGTFMLRNTSGAGLRLMEDASLRRNTGYLLEKSLDPATGKLKTKGGLLSTDIRRTLAVRARRAANAQVSQQLVRATLEQYSRRVVDWTEKADDEVMWSPTLLNFIGNSKKGSDDVLMYALENGLNEGEELANWLERTTIKNQEYLKKLLVENGDMELRAVPKVVADRLEDYTKTVGGENLRVMWRNPTQMWKTLVLSGSPRWIMNNIVGNTIFLKLQGGKLSDVVRQLDGRWARHVRRAVGMKEENQFKAALRDVMPGGVRERVEGAGLYDAEFAAGSKMTQYTDDTLAGRMAKRMQQSTKLNENPVMNTARTWSDFAHRINEGIEEAYRRASYIRASDKVAMRAGVLSVGHRFWTTKENLRAAFRNGMDEKTAAGLVDEVNKFLNDYNKMTPSGQNYIRPYLIPFWGFYRHATRMLLSMPFEHPGKSQLLRQFNAAAEDQRDELGLLPTWLENAVPLGPAPGNAGDFRFLSTAGMNPFNTVLDSPMNLLHPYAKMLYEQSSGRSTFTGKQFTDPNVYKAFGSEQQYRMVNGEPVPVDKVTPGLLQHVLSQIPQYNLVSDIFAGGATYDTADIIDIMRGQGTVIDPETGQPVYPKGVLETLAKLMGYSTSTFNPAEFTERRLAEMEAVLKLAEAREEATG